MILVGMVLCLNFDRNIEGIGAPPSKIDRGKIKKFLLYALPSDRITRLFKLLLARYSGKVESSSSSSFHKETRIMNSMM